jgi:hypothetical protein
MTNILYILYTTPTRFPRSVSPQMATLLSAISAPVLVDNHPLNETSVRMVVSSTDENGNQINTLYLRDEDGQVTMTFFRSFPDPDA